MRGTRQETPQIEEEIIWEDVTIPVEDENNEELIPSLSNDRKNIILWKSVLLGINNQRLMNMFREESQLCNEPNITNSEKKRAFCEEEEAFFTQTRFTDINISTEESDKILFTLESDIMTPDSLVGFFRVSSWEIRFLSNFYLGNELIGFSPNARYFAYRGMCWEAKCGISIRDSETLEEVWTINNPEYLDMRQKDVKFLRWVTDTEIEYELAGEILQISF